MPSRLLEARGSPATIGLFSGKSPAICATAQHLSTTAAPTSREQRQGDDSDTPKRGDDRGARRSVQPTEAPVRDRSEIQHHMTASAATPARLTAKECRNSRVIGLGRADLQRLCATARGPRLR